MADMGKSEVTRLVDDFYDAADVLSCDLPNTESLYECFGVVADPSLTISSAPPPSFGGPGGMG